MSAGLRDNLEIEGFDVLVAYTVREARTLALDRRPDIVLLDVMLPDGDGVGLCRSLRLQGFSEPIIMLTARGEEIDKVLGLEVGADDYVVKPFSLRELLARIHARLRRNGGAGENESIATVGVAEVDLRRCRVMRNGEELELSAREFDLLRYLIEHRGEVVSRESLLAHVWGHQREVASRTVDNFIVRLRKKIEVDPANPRLLITVHGSGYRLLEE